MVVLKSQLESLSENSNELFQLSAWGDASPRSGGSSSQEEILRNGFEKLTDNHGVTHLDLAAHGTVSLSR